MRLSLQWLNEYVDVADFMARPHSLADLLTKAGLEVESIEDRTQVYRMVEVGMILTKEVHPNSDRLSVCQVTTGEGIVHQIVCGAQNHKANDFVVVALPGAVLPGNFAIQKSVIRGVASDGMLCSEKELGLPGTSEGILILPSGSPLGKNFGEWRGLGDVIMELKVTPNRADCLSHWGLAREISALTKRPLKPIAIPFFETQKSNQSNNEIRVSVGEESLCTRYLGRMISGVRVGPSPAWLVQRLASVGVGSINNIVDITNFVMWELGQPLHAFDADRIVNHSIEVRAAKSTETLVALNGVNLEFTGGELCICDGRGPVALAGVMGGKDSGVQPTTSQIFIESAAFSPVPVRRASRKFGLQTDSAHRFSRGVDPMGVRLALDRACSLVLELAGGEISEKISEFSVKSPAKNPIALHIGKLASRLGYPVSREQARDVLVSLQNEVQEKSAEEFLVTPPSYRVDLEIDMDLVEEVGRVLGYDKIPEASPQLGFSPTPHDPEYLRDHTSSQVLCRSGFQQGVHSVFSPRTSEREFLGKGSHQRLPWTLGEVPISLRNPLSEEQAVLRESLSYGLWKAAQGNFHQGEVRGRLFEVGPCFAKANGPLRTVGAADAAQNVSYQQIRRVGLVAWGEEPRSPWKSATKVPLVLEIKGAIQHWASEFGLKVEFANVSDRGETPQFLHRGQAAWILIEGQRCGVLGTLHPQVLEGEKFRSPCALAEWEVSQALFGRIHQSAFRAPSRFPRMERDLALLVPKSVPAEQVRGWILESGGPFLRDAYVFDAFTPEGLGVGMKSLGFALRFQNDEATLQEALVSEAQTAILRALEAHGVRLRV